MQIEIKMLKTAMGSDRDAHGIAIATRAYLAGETYFVGNELARVFISMGIAEEKTSLLESSEVEPQDKVVHRPKKNKKMRGAPENKSGGQ